MMCMTRSSAVDNTLQTSSYLKNMFVMCFTPWWAVENTLQTPWQHITNTLTTRYKHLTHLTQSRHVLHTCLKYVIWQTQYVTGQTYHVMWQTYHVILLTYYVTWQTYYVLLQTYYVLLQTYSTSNTLNINTHYTLTSSHTTPWVKVSKETHMKNKRHTRHSRGWC